MEEEDAKSDGSADVDLYQILGVSDTSTLEEIVSQSKEKIVPYIGSLNPSRQAP